MNLFDSVKLKKWQIVDYGYTTQATPISLEQYNLWVKKDKHLPLTYLEGERQQKRQNLVEYWSEYESAFVFLFSYHEAHYQLNEFYASDPSWNKLKIASYTLGFEGLDYHHKVCEHLTEIGEELKTQFVGLEYKITFDTQPVLDRDLAFRAGLGWFGKNSMLINRHHGSFTIIGSILLNKKIPNIKEENHIETDHCGQCTRCIDACPTSAIDPVSRTIIARDCISTFTIEQFKAETIPSTNMTLSEGTIFGCDICQDVCPWNKRIDRQLKKLKRSKLIEAQNKIINFFLKRDTKEIRDEMNLLSEGAYKKIFKNTSFERSGKRGVLKNLVFYIKELNIFS